MARNPVTGQATMLHTSSGIASLYVCDSLGSPVVLLTDFNSTSLQHKCNPHGLPTLQQSPDGNGVGQNPHAFKSGVQDRATGFVKFGARWYDPVSGTWTQQDTLDTPLSIGNANRYAYTGNDPINNSDPSGAISSSDIKLVVRVIELYLGGEDIAKVLTSDELAELNDVLVGVAASLICAAIPGLDEVTLGFGCVVVGAAAEQVAEAVNP